MSNGFPQGMSMSPEVQAFSQGAPGPDQTEQLFKERFTETAYQVLYSKFSEIAPNIVTFKILEVDADEGRGVGVFIVNHNQKIVYIPAILTDSQLKPMEMFYCKELNIFLPLTVQWLDEISKMSLDEMGEGANLPREVPQDINLRNLVIPPSTTTGRVGYASDEAALEHGAKVMFKEAEHQTLGIHPQFLNMMCKAPKVVLDGVKLAFERHPTLLQKFAANYGVQELLTSMRSGYANAEQLEKVAEQAPAEVVVLTKMASHKDIKDVFGSHASAAFMEILKHGYAIQENRTNFDKVAVKIEAPTFLASPGPEAGWHRLFFVDGAPGIYYTIPFPKEVDGWGRCKAVCGYDGENQHRAPTEYLVISKNGKEAWTCDDVMGEHVHDTSKEGLDSSKIGKLLNTDKGGGDTPTAGSYGFFMNTTGTGVQATKPFRVEMVVTDGGIKKITTQYGDGTYIIDKDPSRKRFDYAMKGGLVFVPNTAKFVKLLQVSPNDEDAYQKIRDYERRQKKSVICDPQLLLRWMNRIMSKAGGEPVNVKSAGIHEWWIGKTDQALPFGPALAKVANLYKISIPDAQGVLEDAQSHGIAQAYILDSTSGNSLKCAFEKLAQPQMQQGPMAYQSAPGQAGMGPPPGTPGMMQPNPGQQMPMGEGAPPSGDPSMGDPMMPMQSSMSPTDLALGEAVQDLQHQTDMQTQQNQSQMEQMQQQSESQMAQIQQQMEMQQQQNEQLVGILQGIQQRSHDISSATGGMVPAGAEESPAVAAQALAPIPPQQPEPPPMPMMDQDSLSPEMVAEQINPEMVDQASDFQDQGIFDASAIAMLAAAPVLQDIVGAYVPNMEKAIDNLGRVLLTLWMKEKETKEAIGDEAFISLEDKLRSVFKNMGDVVLELSHSAMSTQSEAEKAQMMVQTLKE